MAWFTFETLGERLGLKGRESKRESNKTQPGGRGRTRRSRRPALGDRLEARLLMTAIPGDDYVLSGYSWPNPSHITYSIAPDGVLWDHGTNDLNAVFNAKFGSSGVWQAQIARALATWESVANINIIPVADAPYELNALGNAQSDPRFGDIRFGGYPFLNNTTTLAQTYFPPPNGCTAAGDVEVNTALDLNINSTYDLYSVLLHETGHSLGLDHVKNPAEVMYSVYGGIRTGLMPGDIAGIQAIYGARSLDGYQQRGQGFAFSSAIDVSAGLVSVNHTGVSGVSLASIGSTEYFTFVAPSYASGDIQVTVAAGNISMLSPEVTLYDAAGNQLAQAANPTTWSDNVTATAHGVVPGQRYYVQVSGATSDVFSVGAYAMAVALPSSTPSAPSSPPTPPPPLAAITSIPHDRFEPNNSAATATRLGRVNQVTLSGMNLSSGADVDYFTFQIARAGSYQIAAPGVVIQVFNARRRFLTKGVNNLRLPSARAGTIYYVRISPPGSVTVPNYSLSINPPPIAAGRKVFRPRHLEITAAADSVPGAVGQRSAPLAPISLGSNPSSSAPSSGRSSLAVHPVPAYRSEFPVASIRERPGALRQTIAGGRPKRPGGLTLG